jgi:TRAP-type mannitol/chloroaromatic compound transport system permease small subunit
MPLTPYPTRFLSILIAPIVVCVGYVAIAAFSARWIEIAATLFFVVFHAPATYAVAKGKTVSLPSYYVTVGAESSIGEKVVAVVGLMAPPYCLALIALVKHLSSA